MKLSVKKKYFDLIKKGRKDVELRDAHITFVCEENGETLRKEVAGVDLIPLSSLEKIADKNKYDDNFFHDDSIIVFKLKKEQK